MDDNPTTFLTSSGDDFFKLLEKHLKTEIPLLIKKVLSFCAYNCAIVLSKLDEASITSMENDLRESLDAVMLDPNTEKMEDFLGRFAKCQNKFKFMDGQRKWLEIIAKTCRRFVGKVEPTAAAVITRNNP